MPYKSKVPQYTFSHYLDQQEPELEANPLVQHFRATRAAYDDRYRPIYHYVNPESTLNDPNGLCFWNNYWHLFYQAYPPEDNRQHWGHAYSEDLIHWKDLPYAIYPDPEEKCFSGATFVEMDRVIAMYHGIKAGNMVATSTDALLLNWEKLTGQAVIPIPDEEHPPTGYRIFDPCIWKMGEYYYSLSAGQTEGPGGKRFANDFLFRSLDLENWQYMHPFIEGDRFTLPGDDGACPYFWPIGDRHILLFFSHISGGQYLLGDYNTEIDRFFPTSHGKFNFGPAWPSGVHAPSATPDGIGGVVVIFNMNAGKPTEGWNQIMTLPRLLRLRDEETLLIEPTGDIASLRREHVRMEDVLLPANVDITPKGVEGDAMELMITIEPSDAPVISLDVLCSPDKDEYTRISFYRDRGYTDHTKLPWTWDGQTSMVSLDASRGSLAPDVTPRAPEVAQVYLKKLEPLKLRIFIDKSVVEVFINEKQALAQRVYPSREDSTRIVLRSVGKSSRIRSLDAWQMEDIYATAT